MVVYGFLDFKIIMVMIHNIWYVYEFSFASAHARETYLNIDGLSYRRICDFTSRPRGMAICDHMRTYRPGARVTSAARRLPTAQLLQTTTPKPAKTASFATVSHNRGRRYKQKAWLIKIGPSGTQFWPEQKLCGCPKANPQSCKKKRAIPIQFAHVALPKEAVGGRPAIWSAK